MIQLTNVRVDKTQSNGFFIDWVVSDDGTAVLPALPDDPDDYQIKISVSESPESEFVYLTMPDPAPDPGPDIDLVVDCALASSYEWTQEQPDFNRHFYFKVELYHKEVPAVIADPDADPVVVGHAAIPPVFVTSQTTHCFDKYDGISLSIHRAERLLYRNYAGYPAKLWRKKMTEEYCPECWNPYTQTVQKSNCSTCSGTGRVKSYYNAISVQCAFEYGNKTQQTSQVSVLEVQKMQARITNYPMVRPGDLILNADTAQRFIIEQVQLTQLPNVRRTKATLSGKTYIVSQILVLKELTPSDIEYSVAY